MKKAAIKQRQQCINKYIIMYLKPIDNTVNIRVLCVGTRQIN